MTTSRNSATSGWSANAASRRPPIRCGLTARVAPASSSLCLESVVRARATIDDVGAHRPRRQGGVDGVGIGVERDDHRPGVLDPGAAQHRVVVDVADETRRPGSRV